MKPANTVSSPRVETAASTASGPTSIGGPASTSGPLSTTSQEEGTPEPDPNATYASVSQHIHYQELSPDLPHTADTVHIIVQS